MSSASAEQPAATLLAVACPTCHAALCVGADLIGLAAGCPQCGKGFRVPEPRQQAAEPPPPRSGLDAAVPDLPQAATAPPVNPEMQFAEPVRELVTEDGVIQLRRLTPEEKAARRARRNLVMLLSGITILMAIVFIFGRKKQRPSSQNQ